MPLSSLQTLIRSNAHIHMHRGMASSIQSAGLDAGTGPLEGSFEVSQSFNHTLPATSLGRLFGNECGLIKTGTLKPSHIYIFMKRCKLFTAPMTMQGLSQTVFFFQQDVNATGSGCSDASI